MDNQVHATDLSFSTGVTIADVVSRGLYHEKKFAVALVVSVGEKGSPESVISFHGPDLSYKDSVLIGLISDEEVEFFNATFKELIGETEIGRKVADQVSLFEVLSQKFLESGKLSGDSLDQLYELLEQGKFLVEEVAKTLANEYNLSVYVDFNQEARIVDGILVFRNLASGKSGQFRYSRTFSDEVEWQILTEKVFGLKLKT